MSIVEMNRNILAALQTVIDLPSGIKRMSLSLGVDMVPELTMTRIVRTKDEDEKQEVFEITKRYGLSEIKRAEEIDVTVLTSQAKQFEIGRRG